MKGRFFFSLCLWAIMLACDLSVVHAQTREEIEAARKTRIANEVYSQLTPQEQERLVQETQEVYDYCNGRELFASLHDCRCVASNFFEERIVNPVVSNSIIGIADSVADNCPNIPGVAGYAYTQCYSSHASTIPYGIEDYCRCYANKFAELYEANPSSSLQYLSGLGANAMLQCDAEGLPTPLNPNRF